MQAATTPQKLQASQKKTPHSSQTTQCSCIVPPTQLDMTCRPADHQWNTFQPDMLWWRLMLSADMQSQPDTVCSSWRCQLRSNRQRRVCSGNRRWRDTPSQPGRRCRRRGQRRHRIQLGKGTALRLWWKGSNSQHYRVCRMTGCQLSKNLARKRTTKKGQTINITIIIIIIIMDSSLFIFYRVQIFFAKQKLK